MTCAGWNERPCFYCERTQNLDPDSGTYGENTFTCVQQQCWSEVDPDHYCGSGRWKQQVPLAPPGYSEFIQRHEAEDA